MKENMNFKYLAEKYKCETESYKILSFTKSKFFLKLMDTRIKNLFAWSVSQFLY